MAQPPTRYPLVNVYITWDVILPIDELICFKMVPSGKRLHNYGKSPCYSWVNPLFLLPCSIAMLVYQRVYHHPDMCVLLEIPMAHELKGLVGEYPWFMAI